MGMSTEEYEAQKSRRFAIWTERDLPPHLAELVGAYQNALVETRDGIPFRIIGTDGGEQEDQCLLRDWAWVADALNELAASPNPQSPSSPAGSAMGDRATLDALLLELRNLADAWDGLSGSMSTSPELHVMAKGEAYARMVSVLRGTLKEYALRRYDPSLNVQPETSKP